MFVIVALGIVPVDGDGAPLAAGDGDLTRGWGLALVLVLDVGVQGGIAEIALPAWAYEVTLVGVVSGSAFALYVDLATLHHIIFKCYNFAQ